MLPRFRVPDPVRARSVAVILNGRARGVSPTVLRKLGRIVPRRDLFVSRSLDHSRRIARTVRSAHPPTDGCRITISAAAGSYRWAATISS